MWQLIVLSALFTSTLADFPIYGNWTLVMQFPDPKFSPGTPCLDYLIQPKNNDQNCVCADGKVATNVDVYIPSINDTKSYPILEVTTATHVKDELVVSCTCGQKFYATRAVARSINDNYYVMYSKLHMDQPLYGPSESVIASVSARVVESAADIQKIIEQNDDLSSRSGKIVCSRSVVA